jgi:hypothetical protein
MRRQPSFWQTAAAMAAGLGWLASREGTHDVELGDGELAPAVAHGAGIGAGH